ncbi:hypothetical protein [Paracoccus alkanivorans]|uniref:hypothetical protein n=1 Tax=Paracoccus alkanivorans TaxID=2116655 RepID=UPI001FB73E2E|nr:hypothetical protein [Paracoccus alkanivorans]
MAAGNFFAPISFLYRKWVFDDIGGYDEGLPVLGDWRFNLDFLMRVNIGFLDRYLSHYHHRDMGDSTRDGVYANSVVGACDLHGQYFSVVTNRILRDPSTPEGLRQVIANAHQQRVIEQNVHALRGVHSNNSSSTASMMAAMGVPNTRAIPAAAPATSSVLRSLSLTGSACAISEPMAPPVMMIGPSTPNGPPVPMATAEDSGLRTATWHPAATGPAESPRSPRGCRARGSSRYRNAPSTRR